MVALFAARNFAVGITFKKTEVILTALVGLVVLGDRIGLLALCAIVLGLIGVLVLSDNAGMPGLSLRRVARSGGGFGTRLWSILCGVGGVLSWRDAGGRQR